MFENELVNHREYCLKVRHIDDSFKVEAMICYDQPDEPHIRYSTLPYCKFTLNALANSQKKTLKLSILFHFIFILLVMMISAPLMIGVIVVYFFIPELLNLCGKCLVCYLISLTTFYVTLSYVYLNAGYRPPMCTIVAYIIYLAYFSTIIWLNVTSYDLWKNFR